MGFVSRGESVTAAHSLDDLRTVYLALHKSLTRFPELMETDFLLELQDFLQQTAAEDGVDVTDHGAWESWLHASSQSSIR